VERQRRRAEPSHQFLLQVRVQGAQRWRVLLPALHIAIAKALIKSPSFSSQQQKSMAIAVLIAINLTPARPGGLRGGRRGA